MYESLTPRLDQYGVEHVQATFLTILITIAFLSVLSGWIRRAIDCCYDPTLFSSWSAKALSVLVVLAEYTILKLPTIENRWLVTAFVVLYFYESYNCTTRCFLSNMVTNTTELDAYIASLKQESPVVTWNVQTFHYELRRLFAIPRILQSMMRNLKNSKATKSLPAPMPDALQTDSPGPIAAASAAPPIIAQPPIIGMELPNAPSRHTKPIFPFTRKVVTNEASATYTYASSADKTIMGLWNRAPSEEGVPFQKISLSKVLVLSDTRSREDYFRQQSEFVTRYGREDEFAEFSTSIEVAGYRRRVLVANPIQNVGSSDPAGENENRKTKIDLKRKLGRLSVFWIFTCLGLTVPYRVWFKRQCDFLRVTIVKETKSMGGGDSYIRSWFPSHASLQFNRNKKVQQ